jgi:bifunctional DNA-binding transcriptional regulator/antitoxin component of YhaV-PrlF toxin-antitoxin module
MKNLKNNFKNMTHMRTNMRPHMRINMKKYIRKLQKNGTHSYTINIPKELVSEFGWRERQKLEIIFGGRKHDLLIHDWKKKKKKSSK